MKPAGLSNGWKKKEKQGAHEIPSPTKTGRNRWGEIGGKIKGRKKKINRPRRRKDKALFTSRAKNTREVARKNVFQTAKETGGRKKHRCQTHENL